MPTCLPACKIATARRGWQKVAQSGQQRQPSQYYKLAIHGERRTVMGIRAGGLRSTDWILHGKEELGHVESKVFIPTNTGDRRRKQRCDSKAEVNHARGVCAPASRLPAP